MADMRRLAALAARHDLTVVEDACQAHGASRDGLTPGAAAEAAAFSFYPGKNLGAMGDAGALVTNVAPLATHVRTLRQHGQAAKYEHHVEGWTSRLDTIQAIVLLHKLPLLDAWNDERRRIARLYGGALAGVGDLILPAVPEGSHPVWHLYVIRTPRRVALAAHLAARGVATGRHYPDPVHLTQAYAHLGHRRGAFPVAERLAGEGLSLPVYPGMPLAEVESVAEGIRDFYRRG
jgi:dTDP-4-amino-4,6-dideoxygalactose transaminase